MEAEGIPPTTLKPAPVILAWEIVTIPVPVLVRVKVCGLLDPIATFPKFMLVVLGVSVPDGVTGELVFAAGVPALVKPVQPVIDSTARHAKNRANMPSGARRLGVACELERRFV